MHPVADLPWIAGIRAFEDEIPADETFVAPWREALEGWGIELRDDGRLFRRLRERETELGTWTLLTGADAGAADLARCDVGCPFVGPRVGALAFDVFAWSDEMDRHELFCGLLKEGRDGFAHRPSGRCWPALGRQSLGLDRCTGKWSFDDGAELITRNEGAYAQWICDTFTAPLAAAGYLVHLSWMSTSHNPLRLSHYQTRDDRWYAALLHATPEGLQPVGDDRTVDRLLAGFSADFWLYDFTGLHEVLQDPDLWC